MKIGVTGASGMLGTAVITHLSKSYKIFSTSRNKGIEGENIEWECFDITDTMLLNQWLEKSKLDIVIHCAAMVDIDACEYNVNSATAIHIESTKTIASYLKENNGRLIYISTDSVFDGEKRGSYKESDLTNPINVYAKTKLMGEQPVLDIDNGLVLRVNIIGWTQEGNTSFAEWMLKSLIDNAVLNLFYDVYFSPLHIDNLSLIIEKIIENPIFGLYHCTSNNGISKYDFGKKMAKIFQLSDDNINRVSVKDVNFKADRPKNMVLNTKKISAALACDSPSVVDAIILMKHQYDKNNNLLN